MKIITVAAQKGGVGKTTTVANIAGSLSRRGHKVLMIDLDPHGSLTGYFGLNCDVVEPNAHSLFEAAANGHTADIANCVHECTSTPNLSLIPSSTALVSLDRRYGQLRGMGAVLKKALKTIDGRYSHCIIDCPPMLGILVINALVACESLIVPVQTEFMAVASVDRLLKTLEMIQRSSGLSVPYLVVPTMYDRRTRAARKSLERLRDRRDINLWHDFIPVDTQFREASNNGVPLTVWQPQTRGSLAYESLLDEALYLTEPLPLREAG